VAGDSGWREVRVPLPAGTHEVRWRYAKDGAGASGTDAGWVDQVRVRPPDAAPWLNLLLGPAGRGVR
jgi:hypothetical protein